MAGYANLHYASLSTFNEREQIFRCVYPKLGYRLLEHKMFHLNQSPIDYCSAADIVNHFVLIEEEGVSSPKFDHLIPAKRLFRR